MELISMKVFDFMSDTYEVQITDRFHFIVSGYHKSCMDWLWVILIGYMDDQLPSDKETLFNIVRDDFIVRLQFTSDDDLIELIIKIGSRGILSEMMLINGCNQVLEPRVSAYQSVFPKYIKEYIYSIHTITGIDSDNRSGELEVLLALISQVKAMTKDSFMTLFLHGLNNVLKGDVKKVNIERHDLTIEFMDGVEISIKDLSDELLTSINLLVNLISIRELYIKKPLVVISNISHVKPSVFSTYLQWLDAYNINALFYLEAALTGVVPESLSTFVNINNYL